MSEYIESGIKVDLTGRAYHRFETLPTYIRLKGQGVKEMDVCWLVPADADASTSTSSRDTLICLELKGYQTWTIPADLLANLEQKAKDTLLMFCAAWLGRGQGSELARISHQLEG